VRVAATLAVWQAANVIPAGACRGTPQHLNLSPQAYRPGVYNVRRTATVACTELARVIRAGVLPDTPLQPPAQAPILERAPNPRLPRLTEIFCLLDDKCRLSAFQVTSYCNNSVDCQRY